MNPKNKYIYLYTAKEDSQYNHCGDYPTWLIIAENDDEFYKILHSDKNEQDIFTDSIRKDLWEIRNKIPVDATYKSEILWKNLEFRT